MKPGVVEELMAMTPMMSITVSRQNRLQIKRSDRRNYVKAELGLNAQWL